LAFASHYLARDRSEVFGLGILSELPLVPGAHETSLWLRKL